MSPQTVLHRTTLTRTIIIYRLKINTGAIDICFLTTVSLHEVLFVLVFFMGLETSNYRAPSVQRSREIKGAIAFIQRTDFREKSL